MTWNHRLEWRAQTPSVDFAARTVASILRDENDRRTKNGAPRWLLVAAAATVLIAGGAWALTSLPKGAAPPVETRDAVSAAPLSNPSIPIRREPDDPVAEPPRKAPLAPVVTLPRRKEALTAPPTSLPDGGRKIIVPRCNCQEAICDCLEAH
jgi:hypothetical protein